MPHSRARLGRWPSGIPGYLRLLVSRCSSALRRIACVLQGQEAQMIEIPCGRDDLALIDHYIAQTKQRLTEQTYRVHQLTAADQGTVQAEETFRGMQKTLSGLRAFREQLVFDRLGQ